MPVWNTSFNPWEPTDYSVRPVPYVPAGSWVNQGYYKNLASGKVPGWAGGATGVNLNTIPGGGTYPGAPNARSGIHSTPIDPVTGVPLTGGSGGGGYPIGSSPTPQLSDAIQGLLTPGLVPDIARQSAELGGGRGVGGSPAGASTAVRMSEQDYLQRLGLANTLLSGEASRELPYQITPYQSAELANQFAIASMRNFGLGYGGGVGRSGGSGTVGGAGTGGGGFPSGYGGYGGYGGGEGSGPAGLGRTPMTLDDAYDWLGFGDFGSQPGDWTNPPQSEGEFMDLLGI